MAITESGIYGVTFEGALQNTLAIDWDLETHKGALFTDSITPNFNTDTAYGVAPYDANETSGGSWPAGGVAVTGTAITLSGGTATFDATDVSQANSTVTSAMGYLLYAAALSNEALILVDFISAVTTVAGTLTITWNASGIWTVASASA